MKKMYLDPDFEIVNFKLDANILASSQETTHPEIDGGEVGGEDFEEFGD